MSAKRICVVGGGFAGVAAARTILDRYSDLRVTLVDRTGLATMVPALPDVLSGRVSKEAFARPLVEVFRRHTPDRFSLATDEITGIDLAERKLTGNEGTYQYDGLVVATGSTPEYYGFAPENGRLHTVHTLTAALAFRDAVARRLEKGPVEVIVVGGGYTGLEVAASLRKGAKSGAHRLGITVVEAAPEVVTFLDAKIRQRIADYFAGLDIPIRTGTTLKEYADETAVLSDGSRVEKCLVCWSAGMRAPETKISGALEREKDGRICVSEHLQLPGHPEVFVAGDTAALEKEGRVLRRAVNFSYYSGKAAGRNVAAYLSGKRLRPFRPIDLGWIIPLGDVSTGRIFGSMRVGDAFGLRLHYTMCGFRHFGAKEAWEFYRTALHLGRSPEPLSSPSSRPESGPAPG
ncbi:MAG: NAD(P)/FAD-dependent oxidoreductase [Spirochaetaceae bacterium]